MFNGSGVAIVTPFKGAQIDIEAYKKLIAFHLENKTQALIVLGTTGEASTISHNERELLIKTAIEKAGGKIPVIVGTGSNSTEATINYTKEAEQLGADGVLVVTPYYNKATQKGLIAHYTEIAKSTKLPVILYNVPSRTGVNILPETVAELAKVENIIAIKEASGNISQILEVKRLTPNTFKIYSGNDDQVIPIYSCGGHGVISVSANIIPGEMQEMCRAFMEGRVDDALNLQLKYKKLIDCLFIEVNPIPVKAALHEMKYIENQLRLPLTMMEEENFKKLKNEMKAQNII
ncbi:4-hydroxy-tetrahydrodipicolinate synthase [Alkaliphilus peptidifermentans]|uniref:4-hydroxy-tetrahydrodipicolinate synthase n=1 Tax=Alkaliphilus peptidifermentans DSM 18978 TaxID=1120976 RepID=A0A1G5CIQ9_9FIRM|nr:4-hydroxy-tetrahydrodipicolinate synthase [Alkaliphilus peptidifermentans]SCY02204.1 4-hydroxy-tetrahydrodipicolinate synthase [Alkaliphilus peptidifermentans DSM 18978]